MSEFTSAQGIERFVKLLELAKLDVKPHQLSGVKWMLKKETDEKPFDGVRGGINADEMGLGKTIMMIGTIVCNFQRRTLIVVPFALLEQWCTEIYRVTGHEPLVYHGISKKDYDIEAISAAPIVLTTYGHVTYSETKKKLLHKIKWDRVVCDEAHHMRNGSNTHVFTGVRKLSASIRWLLTGTPIQNKKNDFYALLTVLGVSTSRFKDEGMKEIVIKNMVLKRTKEEAGVFLPKKTEKICKVEWGSEAEKILAKDIHGRLNFSGVTSRTNHVGYGDNVLVMLLRARQVCVMPELIAPGISQAMKAIDEGIADDEEDEDIEESEFAAQVKKQQKMELMKIVDHIVKIHDAGISSKIKAVCEELKKNKENGKQKIVFCQFRKEIDQVERLLKEAGFNTASVDGRTPKYMREEYLTSKTIDVLILQIQTGCEGLNLQTFSEVYFVTPHWNPAVEDQAVARCHRIGQQNEVDVFRFEMSNFGDETNSLESHARSIQEQKRELYEIFENSSE